MERAINPRELWWVTVPQALTPLYTHLKLFVLIHFSPFLSPFFNSSNFLVERLPKSRREERLLGGTHFDSWSLRSFFLLHLFHKREKERKRKEERKEGKETKHFGSSRFHLISCHPPFPPSFRTHHHQVHCFMLPSFSMLLCWYSFSDFPSFLYDFRLSLLWIPPIFLLAESFQLRREREREQNPFFFLVQFSPFSHISFLLFSCFTTFPHTIHFVSLFSSLFLSIRSWTVLFLPLKFLLSSFPILLFFFFFFSPILPLLSPLKEVRYKKCPHQKFMVTFSCFIAFLLLFSPFHPLFISSFPHPSLTLSESFQFSLLSLCTVFCPRISFSFLSLFYGSCTLDGKKFSLFGLYLRLKKDCKILANVRLWLFSSSSLSLSLLSILPSFSLPLSVIFFSLYFFLIYKRQGKNKDCITTQVLERKALK